MDHVTISTSLLAKLAAVLAAIVVFLGATDVRVGPPDAFGALNGPDSYSPYFNFDGVRHWYVRKPVNMATGTICAIKSPAATSTLLFTTLNLPQSTSTAAMIRIATSTTAFATTTLQQTVNVAANVATAATYIPTSTAAMLFGPNTWLVYDAMGGSGIGGFTYNGATCQAEFVQY